MVRVTFRFHPGAASQFRDKANNDNMTRFEMNRVADAWEEWAASKKGTAFEQFRFAASRQAQDMRAAARNNAFFAR